MKKIENECVGCTTMGLHCIGISCPKRSVVRFYCDRCKGEATLYRYDDEELCKDCLLEEFDIVEGSEGYNW